MIQQQMGGLQTTVICYKDNERLGSKTRSILSPSLFTKYNKINALWYVSLLV